jgi:hypothetical protein
MCNETQKVQSFTITGNLGADPRPRSLPAQTLIWTDYDPIIDEPVETIFEKPGLSFLTFPLAAGGYGDLPTQWHNCIDWEGRAVHVRKGDRIRATGYRETRRYKKDGEEKTYVQFVITELEIQKMRNRV